MNPGDFVLALSMEEITLYLSALKAYRGPEYNVTAPAIERVESQVIEQLRERKAEAAAAAQE